MAENLGANFTIDISDLKAGLAQANRLIRESESEFLQAAAGMDDWEDSAEGLTKRVKTLSKQVDIQQGKVNALVQEKERIIAAMTDEGASHEEIEKAVDGVNKSIQREGKQLDSLKKKLKQSEKNLDKFEGATEDAGDEVEDMSDEMDDAADATDKLTDEIESQKKRLDKLTREYSNAVLEQGEMSDEARDLKKKIKDLNKELQTSEKRLENATDGLDDLGKEANDAGGGFSIAKGAAAGLVAGGLSAIASGAVNALNAMFDLAESTRETRTNMAKLQTAFESAGLTADNASDTFVELYGVLGDEGKATEAASFLAKFADNEEELAEQTRILTGVFAEYGDSIPTEGLAEGIAASIEMGEVQGVLADALEWQGVNLEDFNEKLGKLKTEKEREALITETLIGLYGESADAFVENNAAVIEAQTATANYNDAMADLGGKFEPLNTAFTDLKTTLIEAVTPAVGDLADGLATLITNLISAETGTDLLNQRQRSAVTEATNAAEAYLKQKAASDELADAQIANVDYAGRLVNQLRLLVDENGNVKEGEEARAEFIINELNGALGTEYDSLSDIIDANGQIEQSVYDVITAKKAQILLGAYEDDYKTAVQNLAAQEKARAIQLQEIGLQEGVAKEARQAYSDITAEAADAIANATGYEAEQVEKSYARQISAAYGELAKQEGILADKQAAYDETEAVLYQYYSDIDAYETASTLMLEGKTEEAVGYLNNLGNGYIGTASSAEEAANEQMAIMGETARELRLRATLMKQDYENGVAGVTEEMVADAEEQATAAETAFEDIGGNIAQGIADGAEDKQWTITGAMSSLVSAAVTAAKAAAGIKSPSRVFKNEVGQWVGKGVAVGIDDSTDDVVDSIDTQIDSALKAYKVGNISGAVLDGANVSKGGAGGSGALASGGNGNVIVNQTNNYSQAHSRYELYKNKQATAAAVRLAIGGA